MRELNRDPPLTVERRGDLHDIHFLKTGLDRRHHPVIAGQDLEPAFLRLTDQRHAGETACCSARRFDADWRTKSLKSLDSRGVKLTRRITSRP